MIADKKLTFVLLVVLLVGSLFVGAFSFASGQSGNSYDRSFSGRTTSAGFSDYGDQGDFTRYYSANNRLQDYWPKLGLDAGSCIAREDMLIQVSPVGCQPVVVRSDLLAEQNVPVFCQLDALMVNPFVDVKQIRNIRFRGELPDGVVGVGFHPARAALRTRNNLLGSPLINNIGYVVVVLRQEPEEDKLPDFVNFTLSATFDYYAGNSLGIGKSEFLLKEVTDDQWEVESKRQSFFKGEYSVRLLNADPNSFRVAIYRGDREISKTVVDRRRGGEVYIPGSLCRTKLRLRYNGFISADKIAVLQVDDDVVEVYRGSKFLNGKCSVRRIEGDELDGSVEISCGRERFTLSSKAKFLDVGSEVYLLDEKGKREGDSVWKVKGKDEKERTYSVKKLDERGVEEGDSINVSFSKVRPFNTEDVLFESEYGGKIDEYFENAVDSYERVVDDYPFKRKGGDDDARPLGEIALERAIELSEMSEKEASEARLIEKYIEVYPGADNNSVWSERLNGLYTKDSSLAGEVVDIDNGFRFIRLKEVRVPKKKSNAKIIWRDEEQVVNEGETKEFGIGNISLNRVNDADRISVSVSCDNKENRDRGKKTLRIDKIDETGCDVNLRVVDIHLEKFARIILSADVKSGGETNFTVGIGIEKRALKLNPDKAREKIDNLNETIQKWESISNKLGNVVKGLKGACFATAGVLTVKNFFTGLSGEALARQQVMRGENGWTKWCESKVSGEEYDSVFECINKKAPNIKKDVDAYTKAFKDSNDVIKDIEGDNRISGTGFFDGEAVNIEEAKAKLRIKLISECGGVKTGLSDENNNIYSNLLSGVKDKDLSYGQLRDLHFNCLVKKNGGLSSEGVGLDNAIGDIEDISSSILEIKNYEEATNFYGEVYSVVTSKRGNYYGGTKSSLAIEDLGVAATALGPNDPVQVVYNQKDGKYYMFKLEGVVGGDGYNVVKAWNTDGKGNIGDEINLDDLPKKVPRFYEVRGSGTYNYKFDRGETDVRYFQTEPYKGMPAFVPIEVNTGFYVATRQTLPGFGKIKAFESNGRPSSFWLCNVMKDGKVGFSSYSTGGDECVRFDIYTGASRNFPGLSESRTKKLVEKAQRALSEAAQQNNKKKGERVRILGERFVVGNPAVSLPGVQCWDFMSPEDCKLLFNVCDPVICPSSRCNFGGAYYVDNVIQSGVVGSVLLCLPNAKEGIVIPVCLTGIKAGIDGYLSILKQHQACLQENIETGRTVGICDQITSVYTCQFFWEQAAPLAKVLLPKAVEFLYTGGQTQGARGGGEYLTVQSAWDNAQASVDYFTQSYAVNSIEAFRLRSVDGAGSQFCRAFVSLKGPKSFETLIEPDSPPQFHSWYTEIPFSDATVPATSQYKVFYHIFAGNDAGVSFNIYLKDPPEGSYYHSTPRFVVASGFVPRGEAATETLDFTAPKGYKQLCVMINDKEECGFKQVTSSFALDYIKDKFVSDEIKKRTITREQDCISGRVNAAALLNPNIQAVAQEAIDPAIYNRGVVRICATSNPGTGTEPERFVNAGYCGDQEVTCWLDKNSVDNALSEGWTDKGELNLKEATIEELERRQKEQLEDGVGKGMFSFSDAKAEISKINIGDVEEVNVAMKIKRIDELMEKTFWNFQKAELWLLRGDVYAELVKTLLPKKQVETAGEPASEDGDDEDGGGGNGDGEVNHHGSNSGQHHLQGTDHGGGDEHNEEQHVDNHHADNHEQSQQPSGGQEETIEQYSLSGSYSSRNEVYVLVDGKPTKIYIYENKVKLEKFWADKEIGLINSTDGLFMIGLFPRERVDIPGEYYVFLNGARLKVGSKEIIPSNSGFGEEEEFVNALGSACPFTGDEIISTIYNITAPNDKSAYVCCPGCIAKFNSLNTAEKNKLVNNVEIGASHEKIEEDLPDTGGQHKH